MATNFDKSRSIIVRMPAERLKHWRSLNLSEQSVVFQELSANLQQLILEQLKINEIVDLLDHLDPRQVEKVLTRIKDVRRRLKIVSKLKSDIRNKVEFFLRFHPKATISLINFNYVLLSEDLTINEATDAIEEHYQATGKFPEILVHDKGELKGEVLISNLVRYKNNLLLKKIVNEVQTINYQAEVVEIIDTLTITRKSKVIVLDSDGSVLGIIYSDDALALFGKLPAESLYDVSGVDEDERPFDSVWLKFKNRYKWLVLNLATAFLAGSMIFLFEDTLSALVILAMYIPIVAGMGGNAASQTFAVMLRGITLGTISLKNGMPAIWREVGAGLLSGILIGSIVAIISVVWNHSAMLGLVVGLSMIGVHLIAGFFGALVPLFLKHLGKDPAATSTIFITTATDVFGLFFLLGLGSLILM